MLNHTLTTFSKRNIDTIKQSKKFTNVGHQSSLKMRYNPIIEEMVEMENRNKNKDRECEIEFQNLEKKMAQIDSNHYGSALDQHLKQSLRKSVFESGISRDKHYEITSDRNRSLMLSPAYYRPKLDMARKASVEISFPKSRRVFLGKNLSQNSLDSHDFSNNLSPSNRRNSPHYLPSLRIVDKSLSVSRSKRSLEI